MAEVIWTEHALSDLNQIAEYIAVSNLPAAKNLVAAIFTSVERLAVHPESLEIPSFLETQIIRSVRLYKRCCFR